MLKEQLSRGKVPPKAKFRADDEISIGEPADSRVAGSTLSSPRVGLSAGLASPRVGLSGGLSSPRVGSSGGLSSPRIGLSPRVQELKVRQANTPTTLPSEDNPPQPAGDFSVEKQTPETERAGRINPPETERAPRVNSLPLTPAHRNLLAKGVVAKSASLDHHYRYIILFIKPSALNGFFFLSMFIYVEMYTFMAHSYIEKGQWKESAV